ncbi:MAG: PIN domain-containing protein [Gammaproteobacteria bacterium]|nr:PIN domain-containing protein [Gammaproteobacteria bacterium]
MREALFVDTGYVIALINENDQHHAHALALSQRYESHPLVTTDAVLLEIGNALSRIARREASQIIRYFLEAEEVTVVPLTSERFNQALNGYERYQDKNWGLVDCLSFEVMRERKLSTALTFDHHFTQAGYQRPD